MEKDRSYSAVSGPCSALESDAAFSSCAGISDLLRFRFNRTAIRRSSGTNVITVTAAITPLGV